MPQIVTFRWGGEEYRVRIGEDGAVHGARIGSPAAAIWLSEDAIRRLLEFKCDPKVDIGLALRALGRIKLAAGHDNSVLCRVQYDWSNHHYGLRSLYEAMNDSAFDAAFRDLRNTGSTTLRIVRRTIELLWEEFGDTH